VPKAGEGPAGAADFSDPAVHRVHRRTRNAMTPNRKPAPSAPHPAYRPPSPAGGERGALRQSHAGSDESTGQALKVPRPHESGSAGWMRNRRSQLPPGRSSRVPLPASGERVPKAGEGQGRRDRPVRSGLASDAAACHSTSHEVQSQAGPRGPSPAPDQTLADRPRGPHSLCTWGEGRVAASRAHGGEGCGRDVSCCIRSTKKKAARRRLPALACDQRSKRHRRWAVRRLTPAAGRFLAACRSGCSRGTAAVRTSGRSPPRGDREIVHPGPGRRNQGKARRGVGNL
jgi:hypothetical protein